MSACNVSVVIRSIMLAFPDRVTCTMSHVHKTTQIPVYHNENEKSYGLRYLNFVMRSLVNSVQIIIVISRVDKR